jgi:D-3-phosphoglycerate dehydrogenase
MKILIAELLAGEGVELLRTRHEVDERTGLAPADLRAIVADYEALIVRSQVQADADLIAAGSKLIVIGRAGVGIDNVDVEAATRAGITVVNAPTGNTIAAAEHTIALLFDVARHLAAADASMRRGEWTRSKFIGTELSGRTFGIVGFGKIGQALASRLAGLQMRVIASDPFLTASDAERHGVELVELPLLLATADVVSLHVPLTRSTRGLIAAAELASMRPGAILLNVSRGGVVDETALAAALRDRHLAGAGLDVFEREPPHGSPLLEAPNVVLTPHLGASTAEAQVRVALEAAQAVLDVLDGRATSAAVNAPLASPEAATVLGPYLSLATLLGQLLRLVTPGGIGEVVVELGGDLADGDGAPLVAAVMLGVLEPAGERVNLVNARALARARGIRVAERRREDVAPYGALLTVSTPTDRAWSPDHSALTAGTEGAASGEARPSGAPEGLEPISGTVAHGEPRLTRLGRFDVDLPPSPIMLVTHHQDRPGTMGRIGLLLGDAGVNIGSVHLARSAPHGDALMVLALDDTVSDELATRIRADDSVLDLWRLQLS